MSEINLFTFYFRSALIDLWLSISFAHTHTHTPIEMYLRRKYVGHSHTFKFNGVKPLRWESLNYEEIAFLPALSDNLRNIFILNPLGS